MEKFMPDATPKQRLEALESDASFIEEGAYYKPLTEEEITERQVLVSKTCIELFDLEEEKKLEMKKFKIQIDPLKEKNNAMLTEIRSGQKKTHGKQFHMMNSDNNMMEIFDEAGDLIHSRRLTPKEKQTNLRFIPGASKPAVNE